MTPIAIPEAEAQWLQLASELAIDAFQARHAYARIARRYSETQRVYHTLHHVWQVIQDVQRLLPLAHDPAAVQLAGWLHDVIYDPRQTDNEARSAAYAARFLQDLQQPPLLISEVQRLILLTRHHQTPSNDANGAVLLDADLAILGAAPAAYARYAAAIRREYAWLSETAYNAGRVAVLTRFLQRPFIYHTEAMRQEREDTARQNVRAEIDRLS